MELSETRSKTSVSLFFGHIMTSNQIFQPTDPTTEQSALDTLQVLVRTIHADTSRDTVSADSIASLARDICSECMQTLKEPEKAQARAAMKVICVFAGADGEHDVLLQHSIVV